MIELLALHTQLVNVQLGQHQQISSVCEMDKPSMSEHAE